MPENKSFINRNEERVNTIIESLVETAKLNFASKKEVSNRDAALEAISGGLDSVRDELKAHIRVVEEGLKRFENIVANAPEAIIVIDEEKQIREWNPKAELLFNRQKDQVAGKLLHEVIIPQKYHQLFQDEMQRFLEPGEHPLANHSIELPLTGKGSSAFDARLSLSSYAYDGKQFIIIFIDDLTTRKRADKNIMQSPAELEKMVEERTAELQYKIKEISAYKYALDESSVVAITDQDGIIKYANDNFCKISKYSREELIGQDHRIVNSGQHPKEYIESLWATITKGDIWRGEFKNKAKDGSFYWVETTIVPILNEKKEPIEYIAIRSDITNRKKQEEQNILYASIISSTDDAVISKDLNGIVISWNKGAEKLFGYAAQEIVGKPISLIIPPHLLDFENDIIARIKSGEIIDYYETERITKTGELVYVWLSISPIKDLFGKIVGVSKISRNITQRIKDEESIRKLNEELETRVKDRTEELESFTYSVSHDLRSPLRAVNGYARILEEDYQDLFDAEGKRLLGEVQANAKKMGTLIDDLLSFSRLGKQEVNKSNINMADLVRTAITEIQNSETIEAEIKIGKLLPVQGDYKLLLQVMINLLSNAIKYSSQKRNPVVEINSKAEKNHVTYSIRDNGVGFDMEYAHKLFGVFHRLHSADEFPGSGVGLAIVHRIISKHKGEIWAESEVDKGATFYFKLPNNN